MPVHNADIAEIFEQMADLLEISDANPFRVRAYRNAARTVETLGRDLMDLVAAETDLKKLPGIGEDLAAKIVEIVTTGHCKALEKLKKNVPGSLIELLALPGLGPKRVKHLYQDLGIKTPAQLEKAAKAGHLRELPGFGAKTEATILEAIAAQAGVEKRYKLAIAAQYAEPLVAYLKKVRGVKQAGIAGSYRRARETVGDIDILVSAVKDAPVMERFVQYDEIRKVVSHGGTRSTVILKCGLQVDLRVVPQVSLGAALHYFTGSKAHNIAIRRLGQKKGLKINEYGVFRGDERVAGETEASVFRSVGLPFIPPELRENQGEIEAARAGHLPKLIVPGDLRGDLHAHTKATDGHNSLKEMAEGARARGLEYLAITEHSRHLAVAHGLDPRRLLEQGDAIDELNSGLRGITLLKGIEVDILEDGSLDLPDKVLETLDLVIGAVHSKFNLPRRKQTERILRAMEHPHFTMLAHPSGRLLGEREAYDVDMERIVRAAAKRGCYLELNAHPERLDLVDVYCRMARDEGVLVSVNSDAHSVQEFDNLRYGIGQARRGWLEKDDVINTRSLAVLRKLLQRTM